MISRARRTGLTLIELVVVLIIVATLAGLVIPMVGGLGRTSDMAASASTQADVANNLQLFFVLQKRYPQGMDSLLTTGGAPALYGPDTTSEATQTNGLPVSGPSLYADLAPESISNATNAEYLRSITRCGFDFVFDHSTAVVNSNNSANTQRSISTSPQMFASVTSGTKIAKELLPSVAGVIPTNTKIIALGVGGSNSAIGKTMTNAPIYPGCDGRYYGRYIAFFQIFASGERAVLIGVSDAYGRLPDYTIQQFNESLPNNGRQG